MPRTYTLTCLSEALSPITHAMGTAGNESIVAREPVVTTGGVRYIPFLSGNALRHRCLREPGMLWLIDQYELRGVLTLAQLNFLLHGGNLTESNAHENTARIAEMKRTWPVLRLIGGSLPNQILCGACDSLRGTLVCEENRRHLPPDCLPAQRIKAAEHFVSGWQYTRGDGKKTGIAKGADGDETSLMIFSGQAVSRGAMFVHGFVLKHVSEVELGAALLSLSLWQESGGTIGGQAARGHGRLRTSLYLPGVDQQAAVQAYVDHALSVKDDAIAWLNDAFAAKADKPKKSKKQKELASVGDA
jgi:hypothetical protein